MSISKGFSEDQVLQFSASLERYSKLPLSSAILAAAEKNHLLLLESTNISEKPGQGLWGEIGGDLIQITGRKQFLRNTPESSSLLPREQTGLECIVLINNKLAGVLNFHDAPRDESKPFISHLKPAHHFNKVMLVSGDRESEVTYLSQLLELKELYANQTPEQKLQIVRDEVNKAPTVFMGDGINDAPALKAATVGIAFGQYSNVTAESAGAVIMENTLSKVDELLHLSIMTRNLALQSAMGGMLFSIIGMALAAMGYIPPVMGAILQEVIDVFATLNSLRLTFGSEIKIDLPKV